MISLTRGENPTTGTLKHILYYVPGEECHTPEQKMARAFENGNFNNSLHTFQ